MVRGGASAVKLEDGESSEYPLTRLAPEYYLAKIKTVIAATK